MIFRPFLFILAAVFAGQLQAQFELITSTSKNISKWYIKNTSADSQKMKSATLQFFHHTADLLFTPSITNPGGGKYQYSGSFTGLSNYTFEYKTIQIAGLTGYLQAGDTMLVSITENAGNRKDTVMAAGVHLYYGDTLGNNYEADVYPIGISACPSIPIFVNAGNGSAGIKFGSFASPTLHDNPCETELVVIIFSNSTLKRKAVSGVIPHCPNGRQWTDYGWPKDEQIYYSFDITSGLGRLQFDTLINALSIGDYVALVNPTILPLSNFNFIKTSLRKLGLDPPTFSDVTGYLTMVGKKSAVFGEANYDFCQDSHANCYVSMEQTIVQGNVTNAMQDFAPCYEIDAQVIAKTDTTSNGVGQWNQSLVQVYPNPTSQDWKIQGINTECQITVYDLQGKILSQQSTETPVSVGLDLGPGSYILELIEKKTGTKQSFILLKE